MKPEKFMDFLKIGIPPILKCQKKTPADLRRIFAGICEIYGHTFAKCNDVSKSFS